MKIDPVPTSIAAFVGSFADGPEKQPVYVGSVADLETTFGHELCDARDAVVQFFANGGTEAWVVRGGVDDLSALDGVDVVSILCLPDMRHAPAAPILAAATAYCRTRRAFFIADPPEGLRSAKEALAWIAEAGVAAARSENAAVYFPDLVLADGRTIGPSGAVAALYTRTRPWRSPAGQDFELRGAAGVSALIRAEENAALNEAGIDSIRLFPGRGILVWGARTMSPDPQWRFVGVRRLALFLEESIDRGLQWTIFEQNGPALWSNIAAAVSDFLVSLWRDGALAGARPEQAFFVRCDQSTTTQQDIDNGIVNVIVGFAPLKPAELVIIRIQKQLAAS